MVFLLNLALARLTIVVVVVTFLSYKCKQMGLTSCILF